VSSVVSFYTIVHLMKSDYEGNIHYFDYTFKYSLRLPCFCPGEAEQGESMAMDATATQWSFQGAYQWMPDYYDDIINGSPRPAGIDNYVQLRIVAPMPLKA
jgi:hypothetical protein